jgi:hypothetical protein
MKKAYKIYLILTGCILPFIITCSSMPSVSGNGSQTGNPSIVGTLYYSTGTLAASVTVSMCRTDFIPPAISLSGNYATDTTVLTDENGVYKLPAPPKGYYNIFGKAGGNNTVCIDSVFVDSNVTQPIQVAPDTLQASGSIRGVLYIGGSAEDKKQQVAISIPGTPYSVIGYHAKEFVFNQLAENSYKLMFYPKQQIERVKFMTVFIFSGKLTDLDTVYITLKAGIVRPSLPKQVSATQPYINMQNKTGIPQ